MGYGRVSSFAAFFLLFGAGLGSAAEKQVETFPAYVDTDLCSRLLPGVISPKRLECSQKTFKEGSDPVLVSGQSGMVLTVNKQKMLKDYVSQFVEATGEVKVKDGKIKLASVKPMEQMKITEGGAVGQLLDVRQYKATGETARIHEQIRHELAMMPYISEFDFISFVMRGDDVILTGWTVRMTNRGAAYNLVKRVEGVGTITNNIEVLPMGRMDNQIRAGARGRLQQRLSRYFWGNGSTIKIIVKNGDITLLGTVATQPDSDIADIQCKTVPGAFHVFNMLRVEGGKEKKENAD